MSGWSKVFYLEVLDASFSIDGVIGAFAFTLSIPLILIGNGIGAFVVREVTVRGIDWISKYAYLKNGAMYSIGILGAIMTLESFGVEINEEYEHDFGVGNDGGDDYRGDDKGVERPAEL